MKIATYNVKGLNGPNKMRCIWQWLLALDLDVICLQEHKLQLGKASVSFCNNYSLFYGGDSSGYSGTLSIIKNSLNPKLVHNHPSGRCLIIEIDTEFGPLSVVNIYGDSSSQPRTLLWDWLAALPVCSGLVCGDFNAVESKSDSATGSALMMSSERSAWAEVKTQHAL